MINKYQYENLEKLILKAQKNDNLALNEILKRQQREVYKILKSLGAKEKDIYDLIQEILFKISSGIIGLKNPKCFKQWQNQIILRHFFDYIRKIKKIKNKITSIDGENEIKYFNFKDNKKTPILNVLGNELDFVIKNSINKLNKNLKKLVVLRDVNGLSYKEISKITGLQEGTIKSRISRAREKIREDITPYIME